MFIFIFKRVKIGPLAPVYSRALAVYIDIWYSKYHLPPLKLILYYRRLCIEDEEYTFDLPIFIKPRWGRRKRLKSWRRMSRKKA